MCLYLKTQDVVAEGILASFGNSSMSIIIPDYDIEKVILFLWNLILYKIKND